MTEYNIKSEMLQIKDILETCLQLHHSHFNYKKKQLEANEDINENKKKLEKENKEKEKEKKDIKENDEDLPNNDTLLLHEQLSPNKTPNKRINKKPNIRINKKNEGSHSMDKNIIKSNKKQNSFIYELKNRK